MPDLPVIMRVVALDLSLSCTGVASTYDGGAGIQTWNLKNSKTGMERLCWIRDRIRLIVAGPTETADLVVLEGYSFGSHKSYSREIAELAGLVKMDLWESGCPFLIVSPSELKKYITGNGGASKHQVGQQAAHRGQRTFDTEDEADAWVLCQMAAAHYGLPHVAMPKTHAAVLAKIAWPALELVEVPA